MEILDLKKLIQFHPDRIGREMLSDKPEMRVALMSLEAGQELLFRRELTMVEAPSSTLLTEPDSTSS